MCTISTYLHVDLEECTKVAEDAEAMDLAHKNAAQAKRYMEAMEGGDLKGLFELSNCKSSVTVDCHYQHLVVWSYLHVHQNFHQKWHVMITVLGVTHWYASVTLLKLSVLSHSSGRTFVIFSRLVFIHSPTYPYDSNTTGYHPYNSNITECRHMTLISLSASHMTLISLSTIHMTLIPQSTIHMTLISLSTIHMTLISLSTIHMTLISLSTIHMTLISLNIIHMTLISLSAIHMTLIALSTSHMTLIALSASHCLDHIVNQ